MSPHLLLGTSAASDGLSLVLVEGVLHRVGLVDVEGEILLQFLNLTLANLNLLEVLLGLLLQGAIRLHEVVVEFDQLLHFLESIPCHLCLVLNIVLGRLLPLGVLIASYKSLVLSREHHDALLELHLGFNLLLWKSFNLVSLQGEVDFDEVSNLIERIGLLGLKNLLWGKHLLKTSAHVQHWFVLLHRDETAKLTSQIGDSLQMGDLPVQEST